MYGILEQNKCNFAQCVGHRATVSHSVACKDLDGEEEALGAGVEGVGVGVGVTVVVAGDRPRTSPCFVRLFLRAKLSNSSNTAAKSMIFCHM